MATVIQLCVIHLYRNRSKKVLNFLVQRRRVESYRIFFNEIYFMQNPKYLFFYSRVGVRVPTKSCSSTSTRTCKIVLEYEYTEYLRPPLRLCMKKNEKWVDNGYCHLLLEINPIGFSFNFVYIIKKSNDCCSICT